MNFLTACRRYSALVFVAASLTGCNDATEQTPVDFNKPGTPLLNANAQNQSYSGIAQVTGLGSQCSSFLLDTGVKSAPAHLVTNGHCVGLFDSQTIINNQEVEGTATFALFNDSLSKKHTVAIDEVVWASMRGTDVAILRLETTLGELLSQNIKAFKPEAFTAVGSSVHVVGIPVQGIDQADWVLRRVDCKAGEVTRLKEFGWLWDRAQAGNCPGILSGNSGSPVFNSKQQVVGVVNTTTIGALPGGECYLGNPCEIRPTGVQTVQNTSYWMPVQNILGCFNQHGMFDNSRNSCELESGEPYVAENNARVVKGQAAWSVSLDGPSTLNIKAGPLTKTDCRDPAGYKGTWYAGETYNAPIQGQDSHWIFCAAGNGPNNTILTKNAGYALLEIDNTAPKREITLNINRDPDGVQFAPIFSPPELSSYLIKAGAISATSCSDKEGYRVYRRVPVRLELNELPVKVCVIGLDEAGNQSLPYETQLQK